MVTRPSALARLAASVRDGTLPLKILNRLSRVQYVHGPQVAIDRYLERHCTCEGWQRLSAAARTALVQYHPLFRTHAIRTVVHVGAHAGAMALALDEAHPGLEFHLLEPQPDVFRELAERTRHRSNMHCLNVAAGTKEGRQAMYVDAFSQASSLLAYAPLALEEFPFLETRGAAEVPVRPLDAVLDEQRVDQMDLLILDVQGYEDEVLRGAGRRLRTCGAVVAELSLQPLYVGSSTFDSVYQALVSEGFALRYLWNPAEGESRQVLQVDGVFVRDAVHE